MADAEARGEHLHRRPELLATILLAVAAVATAWSSYQFFRPEFRPAVEAWVATRPLRTPNAPSRRPLRRLPLLRRHQHQADLAPPAPGGTEPRLAPLPRHRGLAGDLPGDGLRL